MSLHYWEKVQTTIKPYENANIKMAEQNQIFTHSSTGCKKARVYSSSSHNIGNKHTIDDLIAEFRKKQAEKSSKKVSKKTSPDITIRNNSKQTSNSNFYSTKASFTRCKSQKAIKFIQQLNALKMSQRKNELKTKQKQSLSNWNVIRKVKRKQQSEQKRILLQQLNERRRQSIMQNYLKKRTANENKLFQHQIKYQWIQTLRKSKSPQKSKKSKLKLKKNVTQILNPLYQISDWQKFDQNQFLPSPQKLKEQNTIFYQTNEN